MAGITLFERIGVGGVPFHAVTEAQVVAVVRAALHSGRGGRIVTPNVDILRAAQRDPEARAHLADAELVVADGMPLIWASQLAGRPLPERVTGSNLIWSLSAGLAKDARSVFVLGGVPRRPDQPSDAPDGAARAAAALRAACPGLRVAGAVSPPHGFERDPAGYAALCRAVVAAAPDLVYVGLGFPRQERVIARLRAELPTAWFLGCGAAVDFVAGDRRRAPQWMGRVGLEWAHRLASEPRRLAGRYLRRDVPYALRLLATSAAGAFVGEPEPHAEQLTPQPGLK